MTAPSTPTPGTLVRVDGQRGWFRIQAVFPRDGSLTAWGPLNRYGCNLGRARMRSFYPAAVTTQKRGGS